MEEICRYCWLNVDAGDQNIIRPCACRNYLHINCLETFLQSHPNRQPRCEICNTSYKFSDVFTTEYDWTTISQSWWFLFKAITVFFLPILREIIFDSSYKLPALNTPVNKMEIFLLGITCFGLMSYIVYLSLLTYNILMIMFDHISYVYYHEQRLKRFIDFLFYNCVLAYLGYYTGVNIALIIGPFFRDYLRSDYDQSWIRLLYLGSNTVRLNMFPLSFPISCFLIGVISIVHGFSNIIQILKDDPYIYLLFKTRNRVRRSYQAYEG